MALSFLPDDFEVLEIPKPNWESPLQYAVTIRIVEPLPIPKMHTIRYLIVLEAYVENEKLYLKIKRSALSLNNKAPQNNFDELVLKISTLFDELHYKISSNGTLLELVNFKTIKTKWAELRNKLSEDYAGDAAVKYIALTNGEMTKENVSESLKKDPFLQFYFRNYQNSIPEDSKTMVIKDFFAHKDLRYQLSEKRKSADNFEVFINGMASFSEEQEKAMLNYCLRKRYLRPNDTNTKIKASLESSVSLNLENGILEDLEVNQTVNIGDKTVKEFSIHIEKEWV